MHIKIPESIACIKHQTGEISSRLSLSRIQRREINDQAILHVRNNNNSNSENNNVAYEMCATLTLSLCWIYETFNVSMFDVCHTTTLPGCLQTFAFYSLDFYLSYFVLHGPFFSRLHRNTLTYMETTSGESIHTYMRFSCSFLCFKHLQCASDYMYVFNTLMWIWRKEKSDSWASEHAWIVCSGLCFISSCIVPFSVFSLCSFGCVFFPPLIGWDKGKRYWNMLYPTRWFLLPATEEWQKCAKIVAP